MVWSPGSAASGRRLPTLRTPQSLLSATTRTWRWPPSPPFGLEGPWRDRPATEITLQAWSGGIVGLGRGAPDRAPVYVGGQVGEWLSGAYAAIGIQAALACGRIAGAGQLVDLSMLEVAVLCLTYYPVTFFETLRRPLRRAFAVPARRRHGQRRAGGPRVRHRTAVVRPVRHGGSPGVDRHDAPVRIGELGQRVAPQLREWIADRTVADIRDLATAFRIPNAPVSSGATVGRA